MSEFELKQISKNDNRPSLEKRCFEEVVRAFSKEEKAQALLILQEWSDGLSK